VRRQGLIGQPLQQILRLGTTQQLGPSLLRLKFSQQETRKLILFFLRELGGSLESLLQKLGHLFLLLSEQYLR
jgi:hypothetical protein